MDKRFALADEFLADAQDLLERGRLRSALSRAYYAVYHLCVLLFEKYALKPSHFVGKSNRPALIWEHTIITRQFFHEFCDKRRLFAWERGVTIRRLYRNRLTADYQPEETITVEYARNAYAVAVEFFGELEKAVTEQ
ncbi:MAG: HEPN domain-containing protein [Chloroflexi bacterium]|nr:HEPN domain-containing protein [Chloroflexota bacterium]